MTLSSCLLCLIIIAIAGSCDLALSAPAPASTSNHQGTEFVLPKERRSVGPAEGQEANADVGVSEETSASNFNRAIHHLNADGSESEQGQELKRLFSSRVPVPRYFWEGGGGNLANGFKSSTLPLPVSSLASDWNSNWNRGSSSNEIAVGGVLENGGVLSGGTRVSRNPAWASAHEPLGTLLSQWNFKLLHPLSLAMSEERTQKRNANYMCHFKLCQLGASGKRKWNPSARYFNEPSYD